MTVSGAKTLVCTAANREAKRSQPVESRQQSRRSRRSLALKPSDARARARAKSHSPVRHSPKLEHTNGRLDAPQPTTLASLRSVDEIAENLDGEELRGLSAAEKASLLGVREGVYRLASSPVSTTAAPRKFKIFYRDDNFREACARNTRDILATAKQAEERDTNETANSDQQKLPSNRQLLALKALKYRKQLARVRQIDERLLADPRFDVLEFMGATWCKV